MYNSVHLKQGDIKMANNKSKKTALITGVTGQDGSYLAEFLLEKGYEVHGIIRRCSSFNTGRINHIYEDPHNVHSNFHLHYGDLSDANNLNRIIQDVQPDECYNLAAQSHVKVSFDKPEYTADITGVGVLRILESIKTLKPDCKFYQASSSELYGVPYESPQNELTRMHPRSPYGVAKQFGYSTTINYRESYGIHASNGILYNHESPRRGETFVTRKITRAVSAIKLGLQDCLYLGNMYSRRDWGYAPDFVEAMWLILQQDKPDDYVIATNETHSIKEFVDISFDLADMSLKWEGEGEKEIGVEKRTGKVLVQVDPKYYRPAEVDLLLGDYSKAKNVLGWEPKVKFNELVKLMFEADYELISGAKRNNVKTRA
jgi:GDPmannose 4,6-dehydratase